MKNYPLIVKLFVALALFIIVPVVIIGVISNYSILHYSENVISKSGIGKLKVAKSLTELFAHGVRQDAVRLSLNPILNQLDRIHHFKPAIRNTTQLMLLSQSSDLLIEMLSTNYNYHSICFFLDDADYIISSREGVILKDDFADRSWLKNYQDFKKLKGGLSWLKTRKVRVKTANISQTVSGEDVITYIYPLTPYATQLRGAVAININEDALSRLINSNNFDTEGYICILSPDGQVISHVDKSLVGRHLAGEKYVQQIQNRKSDEGYIVTNLSGKRYLITYLRTDFNNWLYLGVFPLNVLMDKVTGLRMLTLYSALILVIIGIVSSFIISRKLYSPVKAMIQNIRNQKGIDLVGNENEATILAKAFDTVAKQEAMLQESLEKNKRSLRENYLLSLLGDHPTPEVDPKLIDVDLSGSHFLCAVIVIDRYHDFLVKYPEDQQYYMKVVILKVSETILNNAFFRCSGVVLEQERIALILNYNMMDNNPFQLVKESFGQIQQEIAKVCDNSISVGIGNSCEHETEIKLSFQEAKETLKFKLFAGCGAILTWQDSSPKNYNYYYPLSLEKHLLNFLDLGLKEDTVAAVHELITDIKHREDLSYDNAIQILNGIIGNTVKYLVESHLNISDIFGENYHVYHQLAAQETLEAIRTWMVQFYTRIFEYREKPRSGDQTHIARILDYIHQNYKKDIDINTLADYVGLSYSHVRKIFYDEMKDNIVNYINNIRIEEAKRLLRQTNMSVNEIALSLGYNNNQSFNRFFKKYEGVTPGEYRNIKTHPE